MCDVGCVLFDDPETRCHGVACVAGGEPVSISGMHDLTPSHIVWLTNLSWEQARESGLSRNQRIRNAHYLRVGLPHIVRELGMEGLSPGTRTRVLADLFKAVVTLAQRWFQVSGVPPNALSTGIMHAVFGRDTQNRPQHPRQILRLLQAANPGYVFSEKRIATCAPRGVRVPLRIHRPSHAVEMLDTMVPSGRWRSVSVPTYRHIGDWLAEQVVPFLMRIRIVKMDPIASPLINFGLMNAPIEGSVPREWVSSLEMLQLAHFMEVEVLEMYACERYVRLPVGLEAISGRWLVRYAAGLVAENVWAAMSRRDPAWRTWLMARDRIACFLRALHLQSIHAPPIHDYGYGRLFLSMDAESKHLDDQIAFLALRGGLCPPIRNTPVTRSDIQGEIRACLQSGKPADIEIALALTGRRDLMLDASDIE